MEVKETDRTSIERIDIEREKELFEYEMTEVLLMLKGKYLHRSSEDAEFRSFAEKAIPEEHRNISMPQIQDNTLQANEIRVAEAENIQDVFSLPKIVAPTVGISTRVEIPKALRVERTEPGTFSSSALPGRMEDIPKLHTYKEPEKITKSVQLVGITAIPKLYAGEMVLPAISTVMPECDISTEPSAISISNPIVSEQKPEPIDVPAIVNAGAVEVGAVNISVITEHVPDVTSLQVEFSVDISKRSVPKTTLELLPAVGIPDMEIPDVKTTIPMIAVPDTTIPKVPVIRRDGPRPAEVLAQKQQEAMDSFQLPDFSGVSVAAAHTVYSQVATEAYQKGLMELKTMLGISEA